MPPVSLVTDFRVAHDNLLDPPPEPTWVNRRNQLVEEFENTPLGNIRAFLDNSPDVVSNESEALYGRLSGIKSPELLKTWPELLGWVHLEKLALEYVVDREIKSEFPDYPN